MNKKKEIEEMAKVLFYKYSDNICHSCGSETSCRELGYDECGICSSIARDLQDAGYGDVKEYKNEIDRLQRSDISKENYTIELYGRAKKAESALKELNKAQIVDIEDCDEGKPYRDYMRDLQKKIDELHERIDELLQDTDEVKKQAVKEFAEKFRKKISDKVLYAEWHNSDGDFGADVVGHCVIEDCLDEMLKEYEK